MWRFSTLMPFPTPFAPDKGDCNCVGSGRLDDWKLSFSGVSPLHPIAANSTGISATAAARGPAPDLGPRAIPQGPQEKYRSLIPRSRPKLAPPRPRRRTWKGRRRSRHTPRRLSVWGACVPTPLAWLGRRNIVNRRLLHNVPEPQWTVVSLF